MQKGDNRVSNVFEIHVGTHVIQGKTMLFMSIWGPILGSILDDFGVDFGCQNGVFGVRFGCQNGVFGVKMVFWGLVLVSKWCSGCQNGVREDKIVFWE